MRWIQVRMELLCKLIPHFYTKTYYTDLIFSLVLVIMPHGKAEL